MDDDRPCYLRFDELLAKSPPNGVANLYPYYGTEKRRTFGENDYAGSVLIYQVGSVLIYQVGSVGSVLSTR